MKKTLSLFISIIAVNFSYSQISVGVKSGVNIATTKNIIAYPKNKLGPYGGFYASVQLGEKIFFQPEIFYSSKGFGYDNMINNKLSILNLNYLAVPLLFGYQIDTKTKLLAGLETGYLLNARNIVLKKNYSATNRFPKKFDYGLNVGLSYLFNEKLGIDIRYCYGFDGLYQVELNGSRTIDINGANRVFQIGLNYSLSNILNCH